jgi:hypothetical protein
MRFLLAVGTLVVGVSLSVSAQQQNPAFKVKHTPPEKSAKGAPNVGKTSGSGTAAAANSKSLQTIEHQNVKATGAKTEKKAPALKPIKDKPNPPMNFGSAGGKG